METAIIMGMDKRKRKLKLFLSALFLLVAFFCAGPLEAQATATDPAKHLGLSSAEKSYLKEKKVLRMPTFANWRPFNFVEDTVPQGYLIDLTRLIADLLDLKIEFVEGYVWAEHMQMLKDGKVDIIGNMVQTEDRKKDYLFSRKKTLTLPTGLTSFNHYTRIRDVANGTLGVQKDSVFDRFLQEHYPRQSITYYPNLEESFRALVNREIDAFIDNYSVVNYLITTSHLFEDDLKVYLLEDEHALDLSMHFAVSKNEPVLVSIINKAYDAIAQEELADLKSKWDMKPTEKRLLLLTDEEKAWIRQHPKLKVGVYHAPPYVYQEFGKPKGYLIDIVKLAFSQVGLMPEFTDILPLKTKLEMLEDNQLDVGVGLIRTKERETLLTYTDTPMNLQIGIFARKDGPDFLDEKSIRGQTIASYRGYALAGRYLEKYPDANIILADDANGMMQLVSHGLADLAFQEVASANYMIFKSNYNNLVLKGYIHDQFAISTLVTGKNQVLLKSILEKSYEAISFSRLASLREKWLGADLKSEQARLTKQEQEFLAARKRFTVCDHNDIYPVSGVKDGQLIGIMGDYYNEIARRLNVTFDAVAADSTEDLSRKAADSQCDLMSVITANQKDFATIRNTNEIARSTYLSMGNVKSIFFDQESDFKGHSFIVRFEAIKQGLLKAYPHLNIEVNTDMDQVIEKVRSNENVHYIAPKHILERTIQKYGYEHFKINGFFEKAFIVYTLGVSDDLAQLLSILNKTITQIPPEFTERIFDKYAIKEFRIEKHYNIYFIYALAVLIVLMFFGLFNILHLKKHQRVIEAEKARFETVMQSAPDGILIIDQDANIIDSNLKIQEMLGYTRGQLRTVKIYYIDRYLGIDTINEKIDAVTQKNRQLVFESEYTRNDGSTFPVGITASPIVLNNQPCGYCSVRDISRQKKTEEKLQTAMIEAQTANRSKSVFLSNMSHELRTPLNAILGYAQIFADDKTLTAKQRSGIKTMQSAGEHLLMLINDILDFSKIEAGKLETVPTEVDLKPFLEQIRGIIQIRSTAKQIEFHYETGAHLPAVIFVDGLRMRQILLNLLSNAVKFTDRGYCSLHVSGETVSEKQTKLTFTVEDSGPGIPEPLQEEIFEPFKQSGERLKYSEGTGLGLAISRNLAGLMDGELILTSPIHKNGASGFGPGTRFVFRVVVPSKNRQVTRINNLQDTTYSFPDLAPGSKRVLIVDDKSSNRAVLRDTLEPFGFETAEAEDGGKALEACEKFSPDLIFMDLRMPNVDGFTALKQLKKDERFSQIPVVAITASTADDKDLKKKCFKSGFEGFMMKPFVMLELVQLLADVMNLDLKHHQALKTTDETIVAPPHEVLVQLQTHLLDGDIDAICQMAVELETMDSGQYGNFANKLNEFATHIQMADIEQLLDRYLKK